MPREEILNCEILVDVKLGDGDYIDKILPGKLLIGWAHAVQGLDFTTAALSGSHTVLAWEEIFEKGRYLFYKNREIAGEAAMIQSFRFCGKMPYDTKVAIIGNGQTARAKEQLDNIIQTMAMVQMFELSQKPFPQKDVEEGGADSCE